MSPMEHGSDLHLETSKLRQELTSALKTDESRKKTDEMKKRAIHTAASYDEFRHMVSCAQLTPVTRKEMEMLSDQKRGWQGRSGGVMPPAAKSGSNGRRKGSSTKTRHRGTAVAAIGGSGKKGSLRSPQCHSQFQRDWRRRCHTDGERQAYLRLVGPENLAVIFRVEMEPDTLGQVLSLICAGLAEETQTKDPNAVSSFAPADPTDSVDTGGESWQASREKAAIYCVDWLRALTRTGRFEINIQFLESKEKRVLARVFDLIAEVFGDGSGAQDPERLESLRKMYAV